MRVLRNFVPTALLDRPQADWQETWLSSVQEMALVLEAMVASMAELGYSPKDVLLARLAVEEAICNAIKHGHRGDPTKVVEVRYRICVDHVLVEVEDQGPGFDLSLVPDATAAENLDRPSGRGLLLIRHYAAWVRHNRKGNRITFCITPAEPLTADRASERMSAVVGVSLCSVEA